MAKRNPMNRRYQKDVQVGSTRKSAAAAKPKRSAGVGSSSGSSKQSSTKKRSSASRARIELPPELKRLQKISFGLLGVAVVLSLLYLWKGSQLGIAGSIMIGVAYALMFTALYIDFVKIRPWIKAKQAGGAMPPPSTKDAKSDKPAKTEKPSKGAGASAADDSAGEATK